MPGLKRILADRIAVEHGLSVERGRAIVQGVFDAIGDALAADGRVELRSFGHFELSRRKATTYPDPRNGGRVAVPERVRLTFRPSKRLAARAGCHAPRGRAGRKRP
jgi:integration host factor subunit beta